MLKGEAVETTGTSVPVWFFMGTTSEPANEVFCKYQLTHEDNDYPPMVLSQGYKINLPVIPDGTKIAQRLTPEQLETISNKEIDQWKKENPIPPSVLDLLDPEQGGIGSLCFQKLNKHLENERRYNVIHTVDIIPIEKLNKSLN